jgi:radical SAM superfamily enzyme YgiQ (UPF0313 family)
MFVTLINPPGTKSFSGLQMHVPNPPIGLAYIAAALKAAGIAYAMVDGAGAALDRVSPYPGRDDFLVQGLPLDEIVARIPPHTTVVGFGCMFSTLWPLTRMVAERVRAAFPDVLLVLGGEHGTAVPETVLRSSPFDVVVLGEGEETFVSLLDAHGRGAPLSEVKGIAFLSDDAMVDTGLSARRRTVDDIPLPDWDSLPIEDYISRHQMNGVNLGRSMPLLATRGCPYQCTFCSNPGMWTQRWIARDPRKVVDEIALYVAKYRVTNFDFQDLTAIVKRQWAIDFCNEIIARGLKITWQMPSGTRSETFDDEVADLLYRSGCRALAFAPESGDEALLAEVKKQVKLDKLLEAVRVALKRGLNLSCFFVIGFPGETDETMDRTLALVRRLAIMGVHDVSVTKFVPYPGSQLFQQLQQSGRIHLDDAFFVSPMDFYTQEAPSYSDNVSTSRLYWMMIWMFVNFYVLSGLTHPFRTLRILFKAVVYGKEETRYAKWFVDRIHTRRKWRKLQQQST